MTNPVIIGNCELWLGDCLEVLKTLRGVDAVVTDPPYGMALDASYANSKPNAAKGIGASRGYDKIIGDGAPFEVAPLLEILDAPEQFWWGANYYSKSLPDGGSWLVWDKRAGLPSFKYSLSEFELCWSKRKRHQRVLRHTWFGLCGTETQDVRQRVHPTQKPVELLADVLNMVPDAATILDPFMGSGTTGVACVKLGRKFIGVEICEEYFNIAVKRITDAYRQGDLFLDAKANNPRPTQMPLLREGV